MIHWQFVYILSNLWPLDNIVGIKYPTQCISIDFYRKYFHYILLWQKESFWWTRLISVVNLNKLLNYIYHYHFKMLSKNLGQGETKIKCVSLTTFICNGCGIFWCLLYWYSWGSIFYLPMFMYQRERIIIFVWDSLRFIIYHSVLHSLWNMTC